MTDEYAVSELISTYKRHGWLLRRVLLTEPDRQNDLFANAEIVASDIDAVWFSRPPEDGGVAWEIRYLGDVPFALIENIDESGADFEASLQNVESRLREAISAKIQA